MYCLLEGRVLENVLFVGVRENVLVSGRAVVGCGGR
jgi:hypothetical protein